MKSVRVEIGREGRVSVDFVGYVSDECTQHRETLRKVLVSFGVDLEAERIVKKTAHQIALENEGYGARFPTARRGQKERVKLGHG